MSITSTIANVLNKGNRGGNVDVRQGLTSGTLKADPRQEALKGRLDTIGQFGKRSTNLFNQAVNKQKQIQAEAEARRQAEEAQRLMNQRQSALDAARSEIDSRPRTLKLPSGGNVPFGSKGVPSFTDAYGGSRGQLLDIAAGMIGTPYAWGGGGIGIRASRGTGKGTQNVVGVDCSGLTSYVYSMMGIKLPRQSDAQLYQGVRTNIKNAKPGDLIGWKRGGHVAIYAGNGMMIESPKPGGQVRYVPIWDAGNAFAVRINLPGD